MRSITVVQHTTFKRGVSLCLKMQAIWWLPEQMAESG